MTAKLKNGILLIRFTDIIIGNRLEQSRAERERERERELEGSHCTDK